MPVLDFHAHILPGADHGSDRTQTACAQLALMRAAGTDAVVATPHFYPDRDNPERFLSRRAAAAERLLAAEPVPMPRVYLGAEVAVCPHLDQMGHEPLSALCVAGTEVILLEMPTGAWTQEYLDAVCGVRALGFTVVLAHIDRYPLREAERLLRLGFSVQLNATAFSGLLCRRRYIEFAGTDPVVALGSDLHGADPRAYRAFARLSSRFPVTKTVFARTEALLQGATPLVGEEKRTPAEMAL